MQNVKLRRELSEYLRILIYFFLTYSIGKFTLFTFIHSYSLLNAFDIVEFSRVVFSYIPLSLAVLSFIFLYKKHEFFYKSFMLFLVSLLSLKSLSYGIVYFANDSFRLPANSSMHYPLMLPVIYLLSWKFLSLRKWNTGIIEKVNRKNREELDDFKLGWVKLLITFYLLLGALFLIVESIVNVYRVFILRGAYLNGAIEPVFASIIIILSLFSIFQLYTRRRQFIFTFKLILLSKIFLPILSIVLVSFFGVNVNQNGWNAIFYELAIGVLISASWMIYIYRSKKLEKYCAY
ncbi:hypothetical protein [Halobacteriovorax sp. DPLXC-1]|uniref:hypothetical protein n=1 Tax=Halobacteriovorax sp. DPLXC-1 TaxID=3110771 RepID=UPI002FEF07D2